MHIVLLHFFNNRTEEEAATGFDGGEPGSSRGEIKQIHSLNSQDFPALGNNSSTLAHHSTRPTTTVNFSSKTNSFSGSDFPSLGELNFEFY